MTIANAGDSNERKAARMVRKGAVETGKAKEAAVADPMANTAAAQVAGEAAERWTPSNGARIISTRRHPTNAPNVANIGGW